MAFIGNNVQTQSFTPAIDYFSGNGVTVTFTLSRPVASVAQVIIAIDNVVQNSSTAYSISGNSITFTSAPLSGTNNIWVQYTSPITTYAAISQDPSVIGDITATGGFLSTGDFGNTYTDGTIVDYVTGNSRITTGPADGLTIYNGGTASRTALMTIDSSGLVSIGRTSAWDSNAVLTLEKSGVAATVLNSTTNTVTFVNVANGSSSVAYAGTASNHPLYLMTNNTERMRIDSSGRVTMPYQVSFNAYSTSIPSATGVYVWPSTNHNTGNAYSTSTGRFTAPVTGKYLITAGWAVAIADYYDTYLQKNGVVLNNANFGQNGGGRGYPQSSISQVISLTANDYIEVYVSSTSPAGALPRSTFAYFTGQLLG